MAAVRQYASGKWETTDGRRTLMLLLLHCSYVY